MSVKFVGRTTYNEGKRLLDLLCRIKNFGIGRIVYRQVFYKRYEEPSYYIVTRVEPEMSDPTMQERRSGKVYGNKVFRSKHLGEKSIRAAFKDDWRLVPKDEEQSFLANVTPEPMKLEVPSSVPLPPLLQHFVALDMIKAKQDPIKDMPRLQVHAVIKNRANNRCADQEQQQQSEHELEQL